MRPFPSPYFLRIKNKISEGIITFSKWLDMFVIFKYTSFLCGGTMKCEVTGKRQNKRGNGLEVPCKYIIKGPFYMIANIECIIKDYLSRTQ